jgi:hypothetical protein
MPITYLVLIPLVNAMAHRTGPRLPMTAGLCLMAAGLLLYAGPTFRRPRNIERGRAFR